MKSGRIFWGLALILCSLCLIFNQFGLLGEFGVWTIILTLMAASVFLNGIINFSIGKTVFGAAVLLFLWKDFIGLKDLSIWIIGISAILLGTGLSLLFHPLQEKRKKKKAGFAATHNVSQNGNNSQHFSYGSDIKLERRFSGGMEYIRSNDFKSADIESHFSGLKVYFDDAVIQGESATLHMDVSFSGVELFIPSEWSVDNRLEPFAGSVEIEPRRNGIAATKLLKLKGSVSFGSIKVIYF